MSDGGFVPRSILEVVETGLCIGCGLCEAVTHARVKMRMTEQGSLRPDNLRGFSALEEERILASCPGAVVAIKEEKLETGMSFDTVWGAYSRMQIGWAADPTLRFEAATGGALTALGVSLLTSGKVEFILHVCADPAQPMRSQWVISKTPEEVKQHAGSRYGPTSPLAGLIAALARGQKFAIIAKPCDLNAVSNFAKTDHRVDLFCIARLALICGGQSKLSKSDQLLRKFELEEHELTSFRYRGFGNPGLAQVKTKDDRVFETSYNKLWGDESAWNLEARCKFCPDALGESADITASDVWPGGGPTGEDAGFNGIITRSKIGDEIVDEAVSNGNLALGETISIAQYNDFQPHQLRKKNALQARFDARSAENLPITKCVGLRISQLSFAIDGSSYQSQFDGTRKRIVNGLVNE